MKKLIRYSTLIDIYESLEILPDIEIRFNRADDFKELDYISISQVHRLKEYDIAIQFVDEDIVIKDRDTIVEIRPVET